MELSQFEVSLVYRDSLRQLRLQKETLSGKPNKKSKERIYYFKKFEWEGKNEESRGIRKVQSVARLCFWEKEA